MFIEHWPLLILTPAVLLLIAALALITREWDQRDEIAARERLDEPTTESSHSRLTVTSIRSTRDKH
jgi:hypothetical protein